jgi:hypothetical protein
LISWLKTFPGSNWWGGSASCLKHMSNYKDDEAQFSVIFEYTKWVVTILLLQNTQLFMEFYKCSALMTCLLVDLSKLSYLSLIFGIPIGMVKTSSYFSLLNEVCIGCSYVFLVYHWSLAISHRYQGKWFMPKLWWWHEG